MKKKWSKQQLEIWDSVSQYNDDPLGFVLYAFPWGEEGSPLAIAPWDYPDAWQIAILNYIGEQLRNGETDLQGAIQTAVASGHGIGKSALVAWLVLWYVCTHPNPQVVVTANTMTQLATKTWRELAKWHKMSIIQPFFVWTATKFYYVNEPEDWFAAAIPWNEQKSEAFAGTHEKHVLIIFDEASMVPDIIWEAASGALTTPGAIMCVFGNPTQNTGKFFECFHKMRHRWETWEVDSRTAKMANKSQLEKWIDDYGEDSDYVRIRVLGKFPRVSSRQFIPVDIVENAVKQKLKKDIYETYPIFIGVDCARFGDDESAIVVRQGLMVHELTRYRELDTQQLASHVLFKFKQFRAHVIFVDAIGIGVGVVDKLKVLGHPPIEVIASNKPTDQKYFNKRAEMWGNMKEWLMSGAQIPDDSVLIGDLIAPLYGFSRGERIQLEKKEDMKNRGLASPDSAEALAVTFAEDAGLFYDVDKDDSVSYNPYDEDYDDGPGISQFTGRNQTTGY